MDREGNFMSRMPQKIFPFCKAWAFPVQESSPMFPSTVSRPRPEKIWGDVPSSYILETQQQHFNFNVFQIFRPLHWLLIHEKLNVKLEKRDSCKFCNLNLENFMDGSLYVVLSSTSYVGGEFKKMKASSESLQTMKWLPLRRLFSRGERQDSDEEREYMEQFNGLSHSSSLSSRRSWRSPLHFNALLPVY